MMTAEELAQEIWWEFKKEDKKVIEVRKTRSPHEVTLLFADGTTGRISGLLAVDIKKLMKESSNVQQYSKF